MVWQRIYATLLLTILLYSFIVPLVVAKRHRSRNCCCYHERGRKESTTPAASLTTPEAPSHHTTTPSSGENRTRICYFRCLDAQVGQWGFSVGSAYRSAYVTARCECMGADAQLPPFQKFPYSSSECRCYLGSNGVPQCALNRPLSKQFESVVFGCPKGQAVPAPDQIPPELPLPLKFIDWECDTGLWDWDNNRPVTPPVA